MKSLMVTVLALLLVVTTVHARHRTARNDDDVDLSNDDYDEPTTRERVYKHRERSAEQLRNRRRRWQTGHEYGYQQPFYPDYPPYRRYENRQENLMPEILRLLDELADYVKRPPPPPQPPQPIYVPYPVPYPVPQYCGCRQQNVARPPANVTFPNRMPELEDPRQNWGFVTSDNPQSKLNDADYVDDSVRPLLFATNSINQPQDQSPAKVTRNSSQAGSSTITQTTRGVPSRRTTNNVTGPCDAATLSCCKPNDPPSSQSDCFKNFGCSSVFRNGEACRQKNIRDILERYAKAYARP